ncbi:hypothetical protein BOO86_00225 [Mycobacterium sp. CBMA 234]|nr:hypothetical protein [Mycolicibacterium sp. CBMA 234]
MSILRLERRVAGLPGSVAAGVFNTAAHGTGDADTDTEFVRSRLWCADGEDCRGYRQDRADNGGQP